VKNAADRQDAYGVKTAPTTVGLKVAARLAGMKTGFEAAINELVPIEQQVQALLNAATVPTIHYPFYYAFAREIWTMDNAGISGDSLAAQAQSLHDKWEARGLATARLVEIADTVFNITVT